MTAENVPEVQLLQLLAPAPAQEPGAQAEQVTVPGVLLKRPAGQAEHTRLEMESL